MRLGSPMAATRDVGGGTRDAGGAEVACGTLPAVVDAEAWASEVGPDGRWLAEGNVDEGNVDNVSAEGGSSNRLAAWPDRVRH